VTHINVSNRTLAIMDNLQFLRKLNNECVDLIAIDPPFGTNQRFSYKPHPPITQAEYTEERALACAHNAEHIDSMDETRVMDVWRWNKDIDDADKRILQKAEYSKIRLIVEAVTACASENEATYVYYMAIRLLECRRVLKQTGSIYLHCDDHANSYLRLLMDAIFGASNYRNSLTWRRHVGVHGSFQHEPKQWGRISDTILYYAKSPDAKICPYRDLSEEEKSVNFDRTDENGRRYRISKLWNQPSMGRRPNQCYEWRGYVNPHPSGWRLIKEKLEEEYQKGNIVILPNGKIERRQYEDEYRGTVMGDIWDDIPMALGKIKRSGYATQKPLELYSRIIKASTLPGDIVLDVFAGYGTTAIAAEQLGRQWLICDKSYRSWTMLKRRFQKIGMHVIGASIATSEALGELFLRYPTQVTLIGPHELPNRDDIDPLPNYHVDKCLL